MSINEKREARELALNYLYNYELMNEKDEVLYNSLNSYGQYLADGVISKQKEIDALISKNLKNYTINRLNYVDRAIIRIAVFEFLEGLAKEIVINEAVDLSKKYTKIDEFNSSAFNNKLLDSIAKSL